MIMPIAPADTLQVSQTLLNLRTLSNNLGMAGNHDMAKKTDCAIDQLLDKLIAATLPEQTPEGVNHERCL
jgi:hypothetical protein